MPDRWRQHGGVGRRVPCTISSEEELRITSPNVDSVEGRVFTGDNSFPYNTHNPVNFSTREIIQIILGVGLLDAGVEPADKHGEL